MTVAKKIIELPRAFTFLAVSGYFAFFYGDLLRFPLAMFEDGKYQIEYFHKNPQLSAVWRYYASYVSLFPNLIGYLISFLPLVWQPFSLSIAALLIAGVSFSILAADGLRIPTLGRKQKLVVLFFLCVAPAGNGALFTVATYSFWHLLFFQILVVLFWRFEVKLSSALVFGLCVLSTFSNPVSLMLVPLLALRAYSSGTGISLVVYVLLIVFSLIYLATGVSFGGGE